MLPAHLTTTLVILLIGFPSFSSADPGKNAPKAVEDGYTMVVLPDTQLYAWKHQKTFLEQTGWIAENAKHYNIKCVLHVGDIVQNNNDQEWKIAAGAMAVLNGRVPSVMCLGNHDLGPGGNASTRETLLSKYFPVAEAKKEPTFGGVYDKEPDKLDNHYRLFEAGGRKWLVMALEFGPRNDVVRWAGEIVAKHPDRSVFLVTHAYMASKGNVRFNRSGGRPQGAAPHNYGVARHPDGFHDGEELWQKLVKKHPNFAMVVSGHVCFSALRTDKTDGGTQVHQMLCDYQQAPNGGSGYLRLMQFLPDGVTVRVEDYSPTLDRASDKPLSKFELKLAPFGEAVESR